MSDPGPLVVMGVVLFMFAWGTFAGQYEPNPRVSALIAVTGVALIIVGLLAPHLAWVS